MLAGARACAKVPERETYGGGEAGEGEAEEEGENGEDRRGVLLYHVVRCVASCRCVMSFMVSVINVRREEKENERPVKVGNNE